MSYIGNQSSRIVYTNLNKFKGTVADLSALTAVTGASSGDMYKVEDSGHAHMYDGTQWVDMGLIVGPQGVKGTGITSIVQTAGDGSEGTIDTYTITYDDTSTSTFEVRNGTAGTIDHITKTGTVGTTDTYTAYADAAETQPLGSFEVYNGVDGLSAYEVAVNNGFVGTEAEWLTSLEGQDGVDGKAVTSVTFTSTTDVNGLPAQSGGTDTYTISYSDETTSTFDVYNGTDATNASVIDDSSISADKTWSSERIRSYVVESIRQDIGEAGQQGFGVGVYPAEADLTALGLTGMAGYTDPASPNYGNYIHTNGSVMVFVPKFYYRIGNAGSPRFGTYGLNSIDISGAEEAGYVLHRAFIDGGSEKHGFFIDKYLISKNAGETAAVSVKNGVPISLTTSTNYTNSNGFLGGTGISADAILLCRSRGDGYNQCSAFMYGALALLATAHAQAATSTTFCAWYDPAGVTNFVKGCNTALSDVNDRSIAFTLAGDRGSASKPLTGSAVPFAKTTHNGQECGIADLNGAMDEPALGVTSPGDNATSAIQIKSKTFYLLKHGVALKDLTAGWDTGTDAWGKTAHIQSLYDSYVAPIAINGGTSTKWGNGSNQVFSGASAGVNYEVEGFMPLNDASMSASGTNQFGNDLLNTYNRHNMFPRVGGSWIYSADSGLFFRYFFSNRSYVGSETGCRGSAYAG